MSPTGPKYAGTASAAADWTTVSNATGVDDAASAQNLNEGPGGGGHVPTQLGVTNFGFALPTTAVIDGIKLEAKVETTGGSVAIDHDIHLVTTGGVSTLPANTQFFGQLWPTSSLTWIGWGGPTSLWGRTWTVAEINSSSFGGSLSALTGTGTANILVDAARITVYWHTAPTAVPTRVIYKAYSDSLYLGNLPKVTSEFNPIQDINTGGTQITVVSDISADTSRQAVNTLTDEAGNILTDEVPNNLTDEGVIPIIATGNSGSNSLIKNGNKIKVWFYNYWWPNGKLMFSGQIENWSAAFGDTTDSVTMILYSDGQELDNYIVRGNPYTYTLDQSQTSQNASDNIQATAGKAVAYNFDGQTWTVGGGVTNLAAISLLLNGTGTITVTVYASPTATNSIGYGVQFVSVGSPTEIQVALTNAMATTPGAQLFFTATVNDGDSLTIYYNTAGGYSSGQMYNANYGGGSGGSYVAQPANDLYFKTFSGTGSTTATFTAVDPISGMPAAVLADYNSRGGLITLGTVNSGTNPLTYTFNSATVFEAIKTMLTLAPDGYYFYVDLGSNILYYPQASTTADIVLTKGKNLTEINLTASIENVKNTIYFTGGPISGVNLYKVYSDSSSIANYGVRLDRRTDNRVTLDATADAIGQSALAEEKDEQYQSTVTIVADKSLDTTTIKPGLVIGFNGFSTFVDNVLAQIVRVDFKPEYVTLTLGVLPKRLLPEFEKVTKGLAAEQTIANPSAPS